MAEFRMPSLGSEMVDGLVSRWLVRPGDVVKHGDVVVVLETGKGAIEVESFVSGTVTELRVKEGETVPVGTVLAVLSSPEDAATPAPPSPPQPKPPPPPPSAPPPPPAPQSPAHRIVASPAARKHAAELGIDLARLHGSGPDGAIVLEDVLHAGAVTPKVPDEAERTAQMRQVIGRAMARSKREIPHYYLSLDIDMRRAVAFLQEANRTRPATERMLPVALLLRAVVLAAQKVPEMNGFWQDDRFEPSAAVHLGVAVSLRQGGLIAPALKDAQLLNVVEIMQAARGLVERVRSGHLRGSEMEEPTLTVTNLGDLGADAVFGVIHPPQVALVGFGRLAERAWAEHGTVVAAPVVTATLAADHRVSDGNDGSRFLANLARLLQKPEEL